MRAIDRRECEAFGRTPKQALRFALVASLRPMTVFIDGRPAAMFGITPVCLLEGEAHPWMLATDDLYRRLDVMDWAAPVFFARMSAMFPRMWNWVAVDNRRARAWLARMGFRFGRTDVIGGLPMIRFFRENDDV